MSLRLRVALLTAAAVAVVEIAIVAALYGFVSDRLYTQVEDDLRNTAGVLVPIVQATGDLPRPGQEPERAPNVRRLIAVDGRIVSARAPVDLPVTATARRVAAGELRSSVERLRLGTESFSVLTVAATPDRAVQVARSVAAIESVLAQLLGAALAFGAAGIMAALLAGAAIAAGALAPLRRLSRAAARITQTGDLTQRVGGEGRRDELARFATSFDAMLDRLEGMVAEVERARRAQRQLVADASHELRAPLAAVRANVELLALGAEAPIGDRDELIADTVSGIERLTALVSQLIDLAREEQRTHVREPVQLDALVAREVDRTQHRYPGIRFDARLEPTEVTGDPEALTRAVSNLLDNAGKWSPAGGTVHVGLRDASLEIRDEGPGIDDADLPHIFERFYRGGRSASVPGSGLGLAIVGQVMASHGGQVTARSAPGSGAVFTATFDDTRSDVTAS